MRAFSALARARASHGAHGPPCVPCTVWATQATAAVPAAGTHLVVLSLKRTEKALCALARGVWLVQPAWVVDSAAAGRWLPEEGYEVGAARQHGAAAASTAEAAAAASAGVRDGGGRRGGRRKCRE